MKSGEKTVLNSVLGFIILACFLSFLTSCQTTKPVNNAEMTNLANELEEANQKIEEIYHRMSVVQFMVDNHERTITDLEKNLPNKSAGGAITGDDSIEKKAVPAVIAEENSANKLLAPEKQPDTPQLTPEEKIQYQSPEYIYNQGFSALKSKKYIKAVSLFKTIVSKYPAHNLADNAIYWTGEIHYTQRDFPEAIRTFNRLIEKYPEGGKVADSLLKIGYSYYSMNDNDNAVKFLKKVVVDFPFSVSGSKAEAMLHKIE